MICMTVYREFNPIGKRFGRLYVIEKGPDAIQPSGAHKARYWCECCCPAHNRILVRGDHLKDGRIQSCGCLAKELSAKRLAENENISTIHGKSDGYIYGAYSKMLDKCVREGALNTHEDSISDEWYDDSCKGSTDNDKFKEFYNWSMVNGADDTKTLVRKDPNKNFSSNNCAWVDRSMARFTIKAGSSIMFNGAPHSVVQVANALGCDYNQLYTTITRNNFAPLTVTCSDHGIARIYGNSFPQKRPVCAIYFEDKNGFLYNQEDYNDFQPTPCLWAVDGNGFVAGPILD